MLSLLKSIYMLSLLNSAFWLTLLYLCRFYKWLEYQLFLQIISFLEKYATKTSDICGVIFHYTEEGDIYSPKTWTSEQEEAALEKCRHRYKTLVHLQVKDKAQFLSRQANQWSLGFGEMYMEELWFCPNGDNDINEYIRRFLTCGLLPVYMHPLNRFVNYVELCSRNLQDKRKSLEVADKHYNLGNDLYELMLDPWMQYTCGYWAKADNLNDAQLHKMELIAKKLDLKPGMKVLEMGCGWGMLCKFLAERYGVECVGVNIAREQINYGKEKCKGLKVDLRLMDYREIDEKFDRVVVVGMLEHVGHHNYEEFFKIARRNLKKDGLFLLHTIGVNHAELPRSEPWLHTYIFPNGQIPFPQDITDYSMGKFIIEDWHNIGPDYTKTLLAWRENFTTNWPKIEHKYGEKFYKMWIFYLSFCAGMFDARRVQLWQVVMTPDGIKSDYRAAR